MTSWKNEKRALKRAEDEARHEAHMREVARREDLTMWGRIEEFVGDEELKRILHALAEKVGLES